MVSSSMSFSSFEFSSIAIRLDSGCSYSSKGPSGSLRSYKGSENTYINRSSSKNALKTNCI